MIDPDEVVPGPAPSVITIEKGEFPWWLVAMLTIIAAMAVLIAVTDEYREAFESVLPWPLVWNRGIALTFILTISSFIAATGLGLIIGLGRVSKNSFLRNTASTYIELVRGIPMLVFIFVVALVLTPDFADLINISSRSIAQALRGAAALSLFYAAFIAEVFRAGIQSVDSGQIEAGRSLGLTNRQSMRRIVLPQAVRNMLPALGNDLISLMKDTSLVSVIAVRELTQQARLYTGSSFRFREGFFILMALYVTLTLGLSLLLRWYEKRIAIPGKVGSDT
ncbi:MAG: amino acid ABC transporter permease [Acidimicrobiia bacterium]|nr:amino acid ABC transporter permease [Acidimicrobiia bacterium]